MEDVWKDITYSSVDILLFAETAFTPHEAMTPMKFTQLKAMSYSEIMKLQT